MPLVAFKLENKFNDVAGSLTGNGIDDKQIWYTEDYINTGYDRNYFYFLFYLLLFYY